MTDETPGSRIVLRNTLREHESPFDLAKDAKDGFSAMPKTLPSKYFYDARGSHLFEMITRLPEYYLTRAETEILRREAPSLVDAVQARVLVEFGSGAALKTRIILDAMRERDQLYGYGSLDVSAEASRRAANALIKDYPELKVEGVIGDFERPRDLPFTGLPRLMAFLGSTIGNLEAEQATSFLASIRREMTRADAFLIGFDLVKDPALLEAAYNDSAGVTAEFNLNLLRVLNRDLGAEFDVNAFRHRATWSPAESRIEMYLESTREQTVPIRSIELEVSFSAGERIRTELSHKYTREAAGMLLRASGLEVLTWCTDGAGRFALALTRPTSRAAQ